MISLADQPVYIIIIWRTYGLQRNDLDAA
jgi:hypothetical protein